MTSLIIAVAIVFQSGVPVVKNGGGFEYLIHYEVGQTRLTYWRPSAKAKCTCVAESPEVICRATEGYRSVRVETCRKMDERSGRCETFVNADYAVTCVL